MTLRTGLPEPDATGLIMAGHDTILPQWFDRPLQRHDLELAENWFSTQAALRVYPTAMWRSVLDSQPGEEIYLPVDVYGFLGGQPSYSVCLV
ncbi:MAG: hypothetical protein SNJ82_13280 [Gemmataceae bacterium]